MARASDQYRPSDVTLWGVVALCCGAIAVLSANLSALLPPNALAALHSSRLEGATLNQLRAQVAGIANETALLKRENNALLTRFSIAEQEDGNVAQRLGAIEVALPDMLQVYASGIDGSAVTASIGQDGSTSDAEGGSISVRNMPLDAAINQPMPALAVAPQPNPDAFAIALGPATDAYGASAAWAALNGKVGTLLIGLAPLLSEDVEGLGRRIVAGPLGGFAEAQGLCARMAEVGIGCRPVPFLGSPLAP